MRCGAMRCGAMRCGAMRCGAMRCGAAAIRQHDHAVHRECMPSMSGVPEPALGATLTRRRTALSRMARAAANGAAPGGSGGGADSEPPHADAPQPSGMEYETVTETGSEDGSGAEATAAALPAGGFWSAVRHQIQRLLPMHASKNVHVRADMQWGIQCRHPMLLCIHECANACRHAYGSCNMSACICCVRAWQDMCQRRHFSLHGKRAWQSMHGKRGWQSMHGKRVSQSMHGKRAWQSMCGKPAQQSVCQRRHFSLRTKAYVSFQDC
eukprot:357131-Chlamydomonas_euryale.AAC.2